MTLFPDALKLLSEKEYQDAIVARLKDCDYLVNHTYRLKTDSGAWRTSTTLKGMPDLMAVGRGHTLWIEVKTAGGAVSAEQLVILDTFARVETNRCWLVRPTDDLQSLADWIERPANAPRRFGFDEATLQSALRNSTRTTRKH